MTKLIYSLLIVMALAVTTNAQDPMPIQDAQPIQGGILDIFDRADRDKDNDDERRPIIDRDRDSDDSGLFSGKIIEKTLKAFETRQSKANEEALQGFIFERAKMKEQLSEARRERGSFLESLKELTNRNKELEVQTGIIKDRLQAFKETLAESENSRKGLLKQLAEDRQKRAEEREIESEERKSLLDRIRERRKEEGTLRERLKEAKPLQGLIKRGIQSVWLLFIFLGLLLLLGGVLIAAVLWGYSRLKRRLDKLGLGIPGVPGI